MNIETEKNKKLGNITSSMGCYPRNGSIGPTEPDLFVKPTDTHQFLDPTSCHPYHCKKGISYSQTLKVIKICSDNSNLDKQWNELKSCLFQKGYSEKMLRKQILRIREHSRESLLKKVKSESD